MTLSKRERAIREEIDKNFKPLFEDHVLEGGIPLLDLNQELSTSTLPKPKVKQFILQADRDRDGRVTYDEFVNQMTREDDNVVRQLARRKRVLNRAVRAVAPYKPRQIQRVDIDQMDALNWGEQEVDNYIEAYDCRPPPFFIPIISLVEIGVFIYYAVVAAKDDNPFNDVTVNSGCPMNSPFIWSPKKRHQAWRFLSYMLLHNGYFHLIFNCLLQLVLGTLLEVVHKWWRVGIVYLLGVIAGSLGHSIFDPFSYLAGASGGCYALIGAHFATVIMNWSEMQNDWTKNPVNFFSSAVFRLIILFLLGGGDTGLAIYNRLTSATEQRIGFAAHGGGFLAGILVGVPVLRNLDVKPWEKVVFWVCLVFYILFTIAAILFNGFCAPGGVCSVSEF